MSTARTRTEVTVTIAPAEQAGETVSVGGGILLEIQQARIKSSIIGDGLETWRVGDFEKVKRTRITHKVS